MSSTLQQEDQIKVASPTEVHAQLNYISDVTVDPELLRIGFQVVEKQKNASFALGWKQHWRAALWSITISTALIMEGYDTSVVSFNCTFLTSGKLLLWPSSIRSPLRRL